MSFSKINLNGLYNHKLVYDKLPETGEFGLDNICILREDFKFLPSDTFNGVKFDFSALQFDNVICKGQKVRIGAKGDKLHFVGFGYWGMVREQFEIVYADRTRRSEGVLLADWSDNGMGSLEFQFIKNDWCKQENKKQVLEPKTMMSSGRLKHLIRMHHFVCGVEAGKEIEELILPDNMFLHIFAITLEGDD